MRKNGQFLTKNEFQRPRFVGGGSFGRKKRVTFVVGFRSSSMEIVSEPATPALKRRLRRNYCSVLGLQRTCFIENYQQQDRKEEDHMRDQRGEILDFLI